MSNNALYAIRGNNSGMPTQSVHCSYHRQRSCLLSQLARVGQQGSALFLLRLKHANVAIALFDGLGGGHLLLRDNRQHVRGPQC